MTPDPVPIRFDEVADLYDSYVKSDFDIPFWLSEAEKAGGKVLELTAGTGRVSLPLLRAGVDLTCVDYSQEMLRRLEQKLVIAGLHCPVHCIDIAALSLPVRFAMILIPFHSLSETLEPTLHQKILKNIHLHLLPDGVFYCSLQNGPLRAPSLDGTPSILGRYPLQSGGSIIVHFQARYNSRTHIAVGRQLFELFDGRETLIETRVLDVNFYLFEHGEFEMLARNAGFEPLAIYGDYQYAPFDEKSSQFMIWKLKKISTHRIILESEMSIPGLAP